MYYRFIKTLILIEFITNYFEEETDIIKEIKNNCQSCLNTLSCKFTEKEAIKISNECQEFLTIMFKHFEDVNTPPLIGIVTAGQVVVAEIIEDIRKDIIKCTDSKINVIKKKRELTKLETKYNCFDILNDNLQKLYFEINPEGFIYEEDFKAGLDFKNLIFNNV